MFKPDEGGKACAGPMSMAALLACLEEQGLGPPLVRLHGERLLHSDALELRHDKGSYRVAELERGQALEVYCETGDAHEACVAFAGLLAARSVFLVACRGAADIESLQRAIEQAGLHAYRDHGLTLPDVPPSFRLFVPALEWHRAKAAVALLEDTGARQ